MGRVEFIAPSGRVMDEAGLNRAAQYFTGRGYAVQAQDSIWQAHQRFAGDDITRAHALQTALDCRKTDMAIAVRGGYGLTRILPKLNFKRIAQHAPLMVGLSDFTAFQLAYLTQAYEINGGISFAGPLACEDFGAETLSPFMEQHFWNLLHTTEYAVNVKQTQQPKVECEGMLWGGNLTVLCSLIGTDYLPIHIPHIKRGILFLEDTHEHPYRIERMLYQLHYAGVLKQLQAIVLGDFSGYKLNSVDNGYCFESMVAHMRTIVKTPILTGLPHGHCRDKLTLPTGAHARLVSARGGYKIYFSEYPML